MTSHWTSLTCVDMILLENICECCPMTCHAQLNDLCRYNVDFCDGLSKPRWNIPRHSILKDGNEYWDCRAQVSEMWWVKGHKERDVLGHRLAASILRKSSLSPLSFLSVRLHPLWGIDASTYRCCKWNLDKSNPLCESMTWPLETFVYHQKTPYVESMFC